MRWPWVSRLAYDVVSDECARLRRVNDELTDHLARLVRVEHGLPERKTEPRKVVPMPPEIRELIDRWGTGPTRNAQMMAAQKLHAELVASGADPFNAWRKVKVQLESVREP